MPLVSRVAGCAERPRIAAAAILAIVCSPSAVAMAPKDGVEHELRPGTDDSEPDSVEVRPTPDST